MASSLARLSSDEKLPYKDLTNSVVKTKDEFLADGGFSEIYEGEWKDPMTSKVMRVAIKMLRETQTDPIYTRRRLNHEIRIWHSLSHKNILPFLGLCHGIGPSPAMISPLCDNGPVRFFLDRNPQTDRPKLIAGVACGLEYLHSKNVVHGDFTGQNILIDDKGTPQLSDFGQSKFIDDRSFTPKFAGTARYLAPELTVPEPDVDVEEDTYEVPEIEDTPNSTKKSDVFGFSMVALEILTGKLPFYYLRADTAVTLCMQSGGRPDRRWCLPTVFTDPMWALLVDCWGQDPDQRPDMGAVIHRLERI